MRNIIRFPRKSDPPRLIPPVEVAEATGVPYATALWMCKRYGLKIRGRYYITMEQFDAALIDMRSKEARS